MHTASIHIINRLIVPGLTVLLHLKPDTLTTTLHPDQALTLISKRRVS
jgi:hypothetical protein